ncbi:MAG: Asp-tRNA(Asn)/Glu-tRNA(Gln) amidotransferase subunit GatA, partial [Candidatus Magasanikbacteria bacterium CG10_big_fil_rev_8_21_14_0_10_43_6]
MDIHKLTIAEVVAGLKNKSFTAVQITQAYLDTIAEHDGDINAFISIDQDLALDQARYADEMYAQGTERLLEGVPFSVKDAICTKDIRSTGGATILDNYTSPFEATVITKIRNQGAILIGKNNCDAFGHGASNENSMYGPVKNPYNLECVAGGSSGGSAAAVAADMSVFSIAEDTGGSIRQPASFCGLAGLRPSYGRNSRYGIMAMASSFDTVGPMANSVQDIALLMEIMAGQDSKDATSVPDQVPSYTKEIKKDLLGIKIGIPKEYFDVDALQPEVLTAINAQIQLLKDLGCKIIPVSLPHTKYAIPVYY